MILVVFFAAYLAENRVLLADARVRLVGTAHGAAACRTSPRSAAMLALALGIVVVQRDLGAALLFYAVFLALLFLATGRLTDVVLGLLLFAAGLRSCWPRSFPHVQQRIAIWLDPWADPLGGGFQLIQALHAFARGGLVGTGLGAGLPEIAGRPPIPAVHTDFPLAAIGEELGMTGVLAVLAAYLVLVERGLRIAASSRDDFRALLAAGLALVDRRAGGDHRRRQPEADPADRDHPAVRSATAGRRCWRTRSWSACSWRSPIAGARRSLRRAGPRLGPPAPRRRGLP